MNGKQRLIAGSALAVASLIVLAWWRSGRGEERTEPRESLAVPEASRAAELEPVTAPRKERVPVAPEPLEAAPVAAAPTHSTLAEIRGRLVFADGSPAAAVLCQVSGWGAGQELEIRYGTPEDWQDPSGTTGADGRFSIRFDPPRAFQFTLEAKLAGFAGVEWRWDSIEPGAVVDVGEVVLPVGGTIEGRIVDRAGNALVGQGWAVYARSVGRLERDGRDETQVFVLVDPTTARFRAEDVMPGKVELSADSDMASFEAPLVTLEAGETRTVDLVYDGPDNTRRITVTTYSRPFHVKDCPDPESIRLHGPDGEIRPAERTKGSQTRSFDDLPDGDYTITIDDPLYLPWSSCSLVPGESVSAKLEGSSALTLSVLDENGKALDDFALTVEFRNVNFWPREFAVEHERGLVRGMFAGDYTVRLTAGERLGAVEVDGLLAGETRALTIRLAGACTLSGRVVYPDGAPAAGVEALLLLPAELRKEVDSTVCDASGRFRFVIVRPGLYVVHATQGGSSVTSDVLDPSGSGREGLELVLPRGGRLRGRLLAAGDVSWTGFRVVFDPEHDKSGRLAALRLAGESSCTLESDGRFDLRLPAGAGTVRLQLPEDRWDGMGTMFSPDSGQELGTVSIEEGAVLERDFEVRNPPGTLELVVRVNGVPTAGLRVQLRNSSGRLSGETDRQGTFGPRAAFEATWSVRIEDRTAGWSYVSPEPIETRPGTVTRAEVAVEVAKARLVLVDAATGSVLAGQKVRLYGGGHRIDWETSDADGGVAFTLTPGEYELVLGPGGSFFEPAGEERRAAITWTATGPLAERVSL